ncbi:ESX secretion-associated protein EspG [Gordonia sp. SID5947]|uniref:ESX secretion-associated protein EspG n=1 Tax=Gordonia sp. SID5947 TaxID=2690315 RepID=UPI001F3FB222|nr:ESX secretion-associated protein EspG [Gordonia sp. SID5947]
MTDLLHTISVDALWRAGELIDVQIWPTVLDMSARYDTIDAYQAGVAEADAELRTAGLLGPEGVDENFHLALRMVTAPEVQLQARVFGEGGVRRILLARRGREHVLVLRYGSSVTVETVSVDGVDSAAQKIVSCLGAADEAKLTSVSLPTAELAERLDAATSSAEYSEVLYALGVDQQESMKLGTAFADCRGYAEIVAYETWEGRTQQASGAVAVYETARGRVVGSPSVSPDGQMWTTLSAGSGHRIKQAIGLLVETLPNGRWLD